MPVWSKALLISDSEANILLIGGFQIPQSRSSFTANINVKNTNNSKSEKIDWEKSCFNVYRKTLLGQIYRIDKVTSLNLR